MSGLLNTSVPVRWEKIEGNGTVTFSNPTSRQTSARFSTSGTYVLRFTAEDDYKINDPTEAKFYSFCDYITVEIKGNGTVDKNAAELNNFKISPNPNAGNCTISWHSVFNYRTVHLYDSLGKWLYTKQIDIGNQQVRLDLSAVPNGVYVAEMENTEGGKLGLKVVKNK